MRRIRPDVDIVKDLLEAVLVARPDSAFIQSLYQQYAERGGLSKKQLQGLYSKALKIPSVSPAKMATLEAIILKKPTREKSVLPGSSPLYVRDETTGQRITAILERYPTHKRVLYFRSMYENNTPLSVAELAELQRFEKLLTK